jgi:hypothetical protein
VADVVARPLADQEARQLGQAPSRERKVVVSGPGQGELLGFGCTPSSNGAAACFANAKFGLQLPDPAPSRSQLARLARRGSFASPYDQ